MEEEKVTKREAFLAMYAFLESYYSLTNSDDVGGLLGGMSVLPDGSCVDPAVLEEWEESVQKVMAGKVNAQLQLTNT